MCLQGPGGGGPHSTGKTSNAISLKFVSLRQLESLHSAVGFQYPQACCLVLLSNLFHRLQAVYYIPAALFAYLRVRKGVLEPAAVVMEDLGRVNQLWEPQSPSPFHCNRWVVAVRWWGCGHSSLLTAPVSLCCLQPEVFWHLPAHQAVTSLTRLWQLMSPIISSGSWKSCFDQRLHLHRALIWEMGLEGDLTKYMWI